MPCLTVISTDQTRLGNTKFGIFAENINFISLLEMCLTVLLEEKATEIQGNEITASGTAWNAQKTQI